MKKALRSPSLWAVLGLFAALVLLNRASSRENPIAWDAYGYYMPLQHHFLHDDLKMRNLQSTLIVYVEYTGSPFLYQARKLPNGNGVMKYTLGMAFAYAPGFWAGHLMAKASGEKQDGLSPPYQKALWAWMLLLALAGMLALRATLLRFFDEWSAVAGLILTIAGTHYLGNIGVHDGHLLTHTVLFGAYAALPWLTLRWHDRPGAWRIAPVALLCGFMALVRPTEAIAVLIPLLWPLEDGGWKGKMKMLARHWPQLILAAGLILLCIAPQLFYWKHVTGEWLYTGYGDDAGEGFNWGDPQMANVLLSYRKGLLVYTPMALLGLLGLGMMIRRRPALAWAVVPYLLLNLYIVSSWSMWWYSTCFSQRALLPSMAILALGLGALAQSLHGWRAHIFGAVAAAFVLLNIFQTLQYQRGLIHPVRMTRAAYWAQLGRWNSAPGFEDLLLPNRTNKELQAPPHLENLHARRLILADHRAEPGGGKALHQGRRYAETRIFPYNSLTQRDIAYIRFRAEVRAPAQDSMGFRESFRVSFHCLHAGGRYGIFNSRFMPQPGLANLFQAYYITPEVREPSDSISIVLHYQGADTLWLLEEQIEVLDGS